MDSCSACGRPQNEVKKLVKFKDGLFICNRCVTSAHESLLESAGPAKTAAQDMGPLPKPKQIKANLDEYVIGQETAKRDLSVAVYNHYKRRDAIRRGLKFDVEIQKSNVMMAGPTGVGKTHIARTIARRLKVPFFAADATKLTMAGYVGDDVESLLQGLLADCEGDIEKAEWGIIYLDEADKLARKSGRNASGYRDVTGEGVQQALLKMVEGTKLNVPQGTARAGTTNEVSLINTENILFIFGGSFAGIEEIVRARVNKSSRLGFGADHRKELDLQGVYSAITEADVLEFGLIPELMGRFPVFTSLLPLTEEQMVQVLTEPKDAIIKQFQALYRMDDIDLQFDEEALKAIGREAISRPTGARALRTIVERTLRDYSYECPSDPEVKAVRISQEVVESKAPAIIVREPVPPAKTVVA